jgi:small ligand-binding sensory domain FIST
LLLELDGRPALDVFYDDIGELLSRDPRRLAASVYAGLPVRGSDTGDYLVRNLAGIDEEHRMLAIAEWLEEGDTLMFCRRDAQAASEDMTRMLTEIKRGLEGPPKGGIYYTCLARGPNLLGTDSEELKLIERELGSFPLVGFFGNGEISHDRLYGYTGVLTLFV